MDAPTLTFDHQDGPLAFAVRRAVYAIGVDGRFSCSIECDASNAHDFMSEPVFCFMRAPVVDTGLAIGMVLRIPYRQGDRDSFDLPSSHLYAGSHFDPWDASVEILRFDGQAIEALVQFLTDDPNYYDSRALYTRCQSKVWLHQVPEQEVRDLM
jgi:hypothetical protein